MRADDQARSDPVGDRELCGRARRGRRRCCRSLGGARQAGVGGARGGRRAPGDAPPPSTKFLLHAGIAYYVFDHFIWKPYRAGDLHGFTHAFTIAKAAIAALFVYHEAKLMATDVKGSKSLKFLTRADCDRDREAGGAEVGDQER